MKVFIRLFGSGLVLTALSAAAAGPRGQQLKSFHDILEAGGWTMWGIIGLSVIGTFLVFFFLFTLRASLLYPRPFMREAEDAAAEGDSDALAAVCESNSSPAAQIIGAAIQQVSGAKQVDYLLIRDAVEDEGARQAGALWQRVQYLLDIAVVAPMVGLLGTVLGMLQSFAGLQVEVGVKPIAVSHGVAKALITTAGGLMVGICAMILYAIFRGRVNSLIGGLEGACSRVLRQFVSQRMSSRG